MTNYEKLVEKLKEVEEIKNDLEAICSHKWFHTKWLYNYWFLLWPDVAFFPWRWIQQVDKKFLELQEFKWELEERHLRIYLLKNIWCYDIVTWSDWCIFENRQEIFEDNYDEIIRLDNTKSFHQQDDKVYWEILNYLNNI